MFQIGEYVIYGSEGVCRIEDITTVDIGGVPKDKKYYLLIPINQKGTKVFAAVEMAEEKMRKVLTKDEADALIRQIRDIEPIQVENEKFIEYEYKKHLRTNDYTAWIRLLKFIYNRGQERLKIGRKKTSTDDQYMKMAEKALYTELGFALGIPENEVSNYIASVLDS